MIRSLLIAALAFVGLENAVPPADHALYEVIE